MKLRKEQKVGKAQRREYIFGTMDEGVVSSVGLAMTFTRINFLPSPRTSNLESLKS